MIAYQFFADGYYAGQIEDGGLIPSNANYVKPDIKNGFIPRWTGEAWEQVENHKNEQGYLDGQPHTIKEYGPYPAGWSKEPPLPPEPTLDEAKAQAIAKVDTATSAAILAGFDYEVDGENLHFSYDSFDQQNFADSANVAARALTGETSLPQSVTWNAYKDWTKETGGSLVRLVLEPASFLALYTQGALAHKAVCMEEGGLRKERIAKATSVDEVKELLDEWSI